MERVCFEKKPKDFMDPDRWRMNTEVSVSDAEWNRWALILLLAAIPQRSVNSTRACTFIALVPSYLPSHHIVDTRTYCIFCCTEKKKWMTIMMRWWPPAMVPFLCFPPLTHTHKNTHTYKFYLIMKTSKGKQN